MRLITLLWQILFSRFYTRELYVLQNPQRLQVDMLREENESIFDKVMRSLMFSPVCEWPNISYMYSRVSNMYSLDLRKRDARKQRPESGSLRSRCYLHFFILIHYCSFHMLTMAVWMIVWLLQVDTRTESVIQLLAALLVINNIFFLLLICESKLYFWAFYFHFTWIDWVVFRVRLCH